MLGRENSMSEDAGGAEKARKQSSQFNHQERARGFRSACCVKGVYTGIPLSHRPHTKQVRTEVRKPEVEIEQERRGSWGSCVEKACLGFTSSSEAHKGPVGMRFLATLDPCGF